MISNMKFIQTLLSLFITLLIMNGFNKSPILHSIAQYGKISIALFGIFTLLVLPKKSLLKIKYAFSPIISIIILFLIFSFADYYNTQKLSSFFYTFTLMIYILFIFILINRYTQEQLQYENETIESLYYNLFLFLEKTTILNFVFWFAIAILFNFKMYSIEEMGGTSKFGGFYGVSMLFGLLSAFAYILSFYLYHSTTNKKKKLYHLILILFYFLCCYFSQSRTGLSIIIIVTLYYYTTIKQQKYIILLLFLFLSFSFLSFKSDYIFYVMNDLTSGRVFIWDLALKEMSQGGIFFGHGINNFNEAFLQKYKYFSNFFKDSASINFHSSFLEIYIAGGLLTLLLFLYFNINLFIKSNHMFRSIQIGILTGGIFEGFIIAPSFPISTLFWIIIIIQSIEFKRT